MEPTLWPGDNILVDKCSGGARIFDVWEALAGKEVEVHRMPGWRRFQRNDVLVFNFPYPQSWDSIGMDMKLYYVKRCIAVPGDTLEINDGHYAVSGVNGSVGYTATQDDLQRFLKWGKPEASGVVMKAYPNHDSVRWTIADMGPFYIPRQGSVVPMTKLNGLLYANAIAWEQKKRVQISGDSVCIGDSLISCYRFKENYYFVSGDKLMNSRDSRYWGLLPEPHIVGKARWIWKSEDRYTGRIRWNRTMKEIE